MFRALVMYLDWTLMINLYQQYEKNAVNIFARLFLHKNSAPFTRCI